jgi:hypothetical protein
MVLDQLKGFTTSMKELNVCGPDIVSLSSARSVELLNLSLQLNAHLDFTAVHERIVLPQLARAWTRNKK